jgi:hypothetical protein
MTRRKDTGRFRVVTNPKALTECLVLSIHLHVILPEDSTARPVQETPYFVDNSVIEGEVMFFK